MIVVNHCQDTIENCLPDGTCAWEGKVVPDDPAQKTQSTHIDENILFTPYITLVRARSGT